MKPVIRQSAASMLLAAGRGDWQSLKVRFVAETTGSRRTEPAGWETPPYRLVLCNSAQGKPPRKKPGNVLRDSTQGGGLKSTPQTAAPECAARQRAGAVLPPPRKKMLRKCAALQRTGEAPAKNPGMCGATAHKKGAQIHPKQPPRECAAAGHCHRQGGSSQGVRVVSGRNFGDAGFLYIFVI